MSEHKVCTYCGQPGHRAHACPLRRLAIVLRALLRPAQPFDALTEAA